MELLIARQGVFLRQIGIVADDLTGAMDAAGPFAKRGLSTYVAFSPYDATQENHGWDVLSCNTQTRNLNEADAAEPVRIATRYLTRSDFRGLFKKIDSTLRGHVGIEIDAILEVSQSSCAFVAPAFPALGRTVRDGVLFVGDWPLERVPEGRDALSRSGSSSLVDLLRGQTDHEVGLVNFATVERGEQAIGEDVGTLINAGCTLIAFDTDTQEHLEQIVAVRGRGWPDALLVGSAGLANAAAAWIAVQDAAAEPERVASSEGIVLVSGSVNPTTLAQLNQLKELPNIRMVPMQNDVILNSPAGKESEQATAASEVRRALDRGHVAVLFWANDAADKTFETSSGESAEHSRQLNSFLQRLASDTLASLQGAALILVGGDTAHSVLTGLHARGVTMHSEVMPGIPTGNIAGGRLNTAPVVTKAGGFGSPNALVRIIDHLRCQHDSKIVK